MNKLKVVILGLGGVGGYIGGLLARFYHNNDKVEICYAARGETLENIKKDGLIVDTSEGSFTAYPDFITSDLTSIGVADYILYCTKSYDVESGIKSLLPCIGKNTVIIPFMNGVDGYENLKRLLPDVSIWKGCVYVISEIISKGHIKVAGSKYSYQYGSDDAIEEKLKQADELFYKAGIKAQSYKDIDLRIWKKFALISVMSTITSYLNKSSDEILSDNKNKALLLSLINEFISVANIKGIYFPQGFDKQLVENIEAWPVGSTTSMQRDFRNGHKTELDSLTWYIVRNAEEHSLSVPTYKMMYETLKKLNKI